MWRMYSFIVNLKKKSTWIYLLDSVNIPYYGLKQSPWAWFGRFTKVIIGLDFKQSQGDHTLFIRHSETEGVTVLLVYVNDIIVTGNDEEEQQLLDIHLAKKFEIKSLKKLKYFWELKLPTLRKEFSYLNRNTLLIFCRKLDSMQVCKYSSWSKCKVGKYRRYCGW